MLVCLWLWGGDGEIEMVLCVIVRVCGCVRAYASVYMESTEEHVAFSMDKQMAHKIQCQMAVIKEYNSIKSTLTNLVRPFLLSVYFGQNYNVLQIAGMRAEAVVALNRGAWILSSNCVLHSS